MLFVLIYRQKGLYLTLKPVAQSEARSLFSYFGQMVDRIHPTELQLNKANSSDTEAPFFGFESLYICFDVQDEFEFDIINFLFFLDGDYPRRTSYGVYISPC